MLSQTQFILLVHSIPHLGEKSLTRLLRLNAQRRLTPEAFLELGPEVWERDYEFHPQAADHLQSRRAGLLAESAELARNVRAYPLQILTLESAAYPRRLEHRDDSPPPVLYALGNQSLLQPPTAARFTFTTAVSNGAPPAALARQDEIASALVRAGGVPVTGHDRTPYKRLALTAQRQNRPILYVLDRGLREALGPEFDRPPFAAARIRDAVFDTGRDVALSPFRLDDHGLGANNRRRDRLIFAMADLVVAVDVRAGGGMADECHRVREQGRPIFSAEGGGSGNDTLRTAGCPPVPAPNSWLETVARLLESA